MLVEDLIDQGALSGTGDAGYTSHDTQRNFHINIFQIVLPRSPDRKIPCGLSALLRHRNPAFARQILSGNGSGICHDLLRRSDGHHLAAVLAGSRPDIHDTVGGKHRILVMLHHQQGIAQIPQSLQGCQQLVVILLVQADAGLIQNIGHANQSRSDLGRETDSLGLSAREGSGGSGEGQVIQSHIHEKSHPAPDLL